MSSIHRSLDTCHEAMSSAPSLAIDIETTGIDPWSDRIAVVSVATPAGDVLVEHCYPELPSSALRRLLSEDKEWITQNGTSFDLLFLAEAGIPLPRRHYDTLVAEQVLDTQARRDRGKDLGSIMQRRLGVDHKMEIDHSTWTLPSLTDEQLAYAANDVLWLHRIQAQQVKLAGERRLLTALAKEMELTRYIAAITLHGWAISAFALNSVREELHEAAEAAIARVHATAGESFNINSPKQVLALLQGQGLRIKGTSKAILNPLAADYPICADVLTYRAYSKRAGFYAEDWQDKWIRAGRIHPKFWQIGAETTRFACSDPNMQQIPRNMRQMIGHEPDYAVVSADYGQLELRIAAFYAQDPNFIAALQTEDFHMDMARLIFPDLPEEATAETFGEERSIAKGVPFTWVFGGSYKSLMRVSTAQGRRSVTEQQAKSIVTGLDRRFPGVARMRKRLGRRHPGYSTPVVLPWGHTRHIPREFAGSPRLINTKIQGSASVGMKEAVICMAEDGLLPYISGLVHDETVATSIPITEAQDFADGLRNAMIRGMERMYSDWQNNTRDDYSFLPETTVDVKIGNYWQK